MAKGSTEIGKSNMTMSQFHTQVDPVSVLKELREFCAKKLLLKKQEKKELKEKLWSYLGKIIPELCNQLNRLHLNDEKNIVYINSLCYVFGDIHGNVQDIYDYEKLFWGSNEPKANYLFIGDYVDRGIYGVEVCAYLFALKLSAPQQFTLVRGNHEIRRVQKDYTFYDECKQKFGRRLGKRIWNHLNCSFERLPLAAVIDNKIFCCHGGVPKGAKASPVTLNDIMAIPKPLVDPSKESKVAENILWNDPIESMTTYNKDTENRLGSKNIEFVYNRMRCIGQYFTSMAAKRFLDTNNLDYMIRAHESEKKGFKFTSDDRVITVFSSSNYQGMKNTTACVRVSSNLIQIILIKEPEKSQSQQYIEI